MNSILPRTLFSIALLLSYVATAAAQGASPAPKPSPTPPTSTAIPPKPAPTPLNINIKASEREIDSTIADDPAVNSMLAPYTSRVRALTAPIGKSTAELTKGALGAGTLGNFVADAIRNRAQAKLGVPVLLAITNSGGLRKNQIAAGDISASDIFELLPFENALVALDLTGEQLKTFLGIALSHRDAQSGARIVYRVNEKRENEIVDVVLGEQGNFRAIDPNATYTIVTIDYLVKRGGDYTILQSAKNVRPLDLTLRDAVLDYVKAETAAGRAINGALDGRFRQDKVEMIKPEESRPQ